MVIVHYTILKGQDAGTKGSYTAPTDDIERGILMTKVQLTDDFVADGAFADADPADLFTIVKAEVR